jgi:hypothetical protein
MIEVVTLPQIDADDRPSSFIMSLAMEALEPREKLRLYLSRLHLMSFEFEFSLDVLDIPRIIKYKPNNEKSSYKILISFKN